MDGQTDKGLYLKSWTFILWQTPPTLSSSVARYSLTRYYFSDACEMLLLISPSKPIFNYISLRGTGYFYRMHLN
jgi:hypothetical protein